VRVLGKEAASEVVVGMQQGTFVGGVAGDPGKSHLGSEKIGE